MLIGDKVSGSVHLCEFKRRVRSIIQCVDCECHRFHLRVKEVWDHLVVDIALVPEPEQENALPRT